MLQKNKNSNTPNIKKRNNLRNTIDGWIFLLPTVLLMYILVWRPTVLGGVWSFFRMRGYTVAEFVGLKNYIDVISNSQFLPLLTNTVKYVIWSLIIGFLPPLFLGIMINEVVFAKKTSRFIIYLPSILPGIVVMIMWTYVYSPDVTGLLNMLLAKIGIEPYGWLNDPEFTIIGLVISMTWKGMGATMLLYYTILQSTSAELYEAAIIDGAGIFRRMWNVTRPALSATLLLNFVNQIIGTFQVVDQPLTMTGGGPNGASATLAYQLFQYGFNSGGRGTGQAMALGVIIFAILLVFTVFYFKLNKKIEDNY